MSWFKGDLPTEYVEGEWCWPTDGSEPAAVVTFASEPSPETGHVGWCWWALGTMGDAKSYEDACRAAEAALHRRKASDEEGRGKSKAIRGKSGLAPGKSGDDP
jgi:hypothetical protein